MVENDWMPYLRNIGVFIKGHFIGDSGLHLSEYIVKDEILCRPRLVSLMCRQLSQFFVDDQIDAVIAPAVGAIALSQFMTLHLSRKTNRPIKAVYTEKKDGKFTVRSTYHKYMKGKNILAIEDTANTGGSLKRVIEISRSVGGKVVATGSLFSRGNVTISDLGNVPKFKPLVECRMESYASKKDCPLCYGNVPINTDLGHGKDYLLSLIGDE